MQTSLPQGHRLNNRFEIGDTLGMGGFGITYEALDIVLRRDVAVKEYYPRDSHIYRDDGGFVRTAPGGPVWDANMYAKWMQRFMREGQIVAQVKHPNIVTIHDLFEANGTAYLVMEFLEGESLAERLDAVGQISDAQAKLWMEDIVDALGTIHEQGFYHLDLSPGNILITKRGDPMLIDFGAAKPHRIGAQSTLAHHPEFAPKELVSPTRTDIGIHTDIYQLAAVIHLSLTGKMPPHWADWQDDWVPEVADEWHDLLKQGLHPSARQRPRNIRRWWLSLFNQARPASGEAKTDAFARFRQTGPFT